jgi:multimeric flavodoxin WrbA
MRVAVLNGNPDEKNAEFDGYLSDLKGRLEEKGQSVDLLTRREMEFRFCVGCFGCWVKTPGMCVTADASRDVDRRAINSDLVLFASPLLMGFPSAVLKKAQDKFIGLIHPFIELVEGECHHIKRYERYPYLGVLLEREADTDREDLEIIKDIYKRTSLNFRSALRLFETTDRPAAEVADAVDRI